MDESVALVILGLLGAYMIILLVWYILQVIAYWKVFTKAGEAGWKSIIPIYNIYTQYKISWNQPYMFWIFVACIVAGVILTGIGGILAMVGSLVSFVGTIINVLATVKLSKAFGHGIGFAVGLFFLCPIFMLILGFGQSQYYGPQ